MLTHTLLKYKHKCNPLVPPPVVLKFLIMTQIG